MRGGSIKKWSGGPSEIQTLDLRLNAACDDAGISQRDIAGYVVQNAEDLAINLGTPDIKFSSTLFLSSANNIAAIEQAALPLFTGLCNYVVIPSGGADFSSGMRARRLH